MRDPLAEPRTTPVRLRRRPVPERLRRAATRLSTDIDDCETAPLTMLSVAALLDKAADELEATPTLRDLIRAARTAGAPPRFQLGGDGWGQWVGESDDEQWRVVAEHKHGDWTVWMRGPDGAAKVNHATEDRIAAAARLCGWEVTP